MDCKYCGVALLDDEIPDGMCVKCPEYCHLCNNVLSWARVACTHDDGVVYNVCDEDDCVVEHLRRYHSVRG